MMLAPTAPTRSPRALLAALALAAALAGSAVSAGAARAKGGAGQYPAAATRPLVVVSPRTLARDARAEARSGAARSAKRDPHSAGKRQPALSSYAQHALTAYRAMQQSFYVPGTGLYRGEAGYTYLWPFSQALAATVTLSRVPAASKELSGARQALLLGLREYLGPAAAPAATESGEPLPAGETSATEQPTGAPTPEGGASTVAAASTSSVPVPRSYSGSVAPPVGPGGNSYYDDNEWVGIELARLYELDHNPEALQQAEQIMEFVMASWRTSAPSGQPLPCPGGVPFSNARGNLSRNTVTNGPGAELAVQLYRITHELRYLQFAEDAYGWVRSCLLEPGGLYADHVNLDGTIQRTLWSYNQGSMMGAGMLLYLATRNPEYLAQAQETAKSALAYFTYSRLSIENPFFVAVYFRNLLYLDHFTHESSGLRAAREYAYYAWTRHRLSNNLFVYGSPPSTELLRQAAIVQINALLSTPPPTYF